ncbi:MAG: hypothetical protein A2Z99_10720 [Treponema sp. GWB1_62_6]|nr:MAG: hypothetical protein A2Z99_10720 [Treponema sp. GWB1_62_6]OHE62793.1 MAG: hypothetical protein A2Y36_06260 [Treponema sp. GWA1_62_8]OHE63455.1 MAG: hypothetical protein A2001_03310 [Treponema sp. GWC1_61_84]OHE68564.1 MAG: hypothetical protein A2413_12505 [Treponema sp. RIFOXYC1_FULL_61_9]HCM26495.1 hypothetical protein [Treponema sp.]
MPGNPYSGSEPNEVLERFMRYVRLDTASDPDNPSRPSSRGQVDFADLLEDELAAMKGPWECRRLSDGSLLVRIGASKGKEGALHSAFLAHLDTYYGLPGAANPRIVEDHAGKRLVVTDGNSLLGADDKSGVAALMTVLSALARDDLPHGPVDFWFTTDEEIGRIGVEALPSGVGESWKVLWTLDGEDLREISVGDLAIRRAEVAFTGVDAHPCLHGQDLVPAHYAAARFMDRLAEFPNPMTSSGRAPFFQVASIQGRAERAEVFCRMASFDGGDLPEMEKRLGELAETAAASYGARVEIRYSTGSANFNEAVAARPQLIEPARRALAARGFPARESEIRGGTDGGLLAVSFPGLAAPDLGTGARNPHSRGEYLVIDELLALPGIVMDIIAVYSMSIV